MSIRSSVGGTKMKVSELIEKLGARRKKYLATGHTKNAAAIQDVAATLFDHWLITGDHEMGADWRLDA